MKLCSAYSATWCARCGDCTCSKSLAVVDVTRANALRAELLLQPAPPPPHGEQPCYDKPDCPLHGEASNHADNQTLVSAEAQVTAAARRQWLTLSARDHRAVSRFTQMLMERARRTPEPGGGG